MFITNPSSLSNVYETKSNIVKNYLVQHEITLSSYDSGFFIFSQTRKLQDLLTDSPIWIKLLC